MESTQTKCLTCQFPVKMCQCKNYKAIEARKADNRRLAALSARLKVTAQQNSKGDPQRLKETYQDLVKKAKQDIEWKAQLYNFSVKAEQSRK